MESPIVIKEFAKARRKFDKMSVLKNNHNVRSKRYNPYRQSNYWEFEIPIIEGFHAKHYSPLVYEEVPNLKRGTLAYDDFWDEQDRRCIEGYAPVIDGVQYPRITGPHYFYLNMMQIMMKKVGQVGKKKLNYPYYRVLDHMLFLEIEKAELLGYGLIIGKARRMGLSYIGDCMTLYNLIFYTQNECAIGAGKKDKAMELFEKVKKSMQHIREEYQVSYSTKLTPNGAEMEMAYTETENKVKKTLGLQNKLTVKTFFSDHQAFEGGSYSFQIFEEIGIQDNLIKSYKATEPCFREGAEQFGVPMLYGTGGEIEKGSRDFKIMYENPAAYTLKKLFIPKYMYYPGTDPEDMDEKDPLKEMEKGVNFFDWTTGRTDEIKALEHILKRRKLASKSKDGYIKELQSNPTEEGHIFLKTSGGLLNRVYLNAQLQRIYDNETLYTPVRGRLEWDYDKSLEFYLQRCANQKEKDKIHIKHGSKVKFIEDENGTVLKIADPINYDGAPYYFDIGGADSYDEEVPEGTGSMGASVIYRCFNGISKDYNMPVCLVHERGDSSSDDTYYSNTLKMAVYYRTKVLVEYSKILIINYFEDCGAEHHLKEKPLLRNEGIANKGAQRYGVHVKTEMKSIITKLLKHEVNNNYMNYWIKEIILDLIDYGDENTDIAMALGMCMIFKLEMFDMIVEDIEEFDDGDILMEMETWVTEPDGSVRVASYNEMDDDPFSEMETFDPRKHLTGKDRENYINLVAERKKQIEREKSRIIEKSLENRHVDPFHNSVREEIERRNRLEQ